MSLMQGHEIATIDVALVTITAQIGEKLVELGLKTANQVNVGPQIETTEAIKLIIKGVLVAQKREQKTLTGNTITLNDNVFNPELVKLLQGGEIEYDVEGNFKKYTPPVVGKEYQPIPFTLNLYSAHYDASGIALDYEKMSFPNATGSPISFGAQDDTFTAPQYTIISAPGDGEAPYVLEMVKTLPVVAEPDWSDF